MLTYLIIGILVQVTWTVMYLFVMKLTTIKDLMENMSVGDWFITIGQMVANIILWPSSLWINIGSIIEFYRK